MLVINAREIAEWKVRVFHDQARLAAQRFADNGFMQRSVPYDFRLDGEAGTVVPEFLQVAELVGEQSAPHRLWIR